MIKKILSNSAVYGLAPQIPQVANILILPIITQDLSRLDYGVAGIIYSYLAALSAIHLLGTKIVLSNGFYHYRKQYKWLWRQMHGFISLWSLFYAFLMGVIIYWVVPEEAVENRWAIVLMHTIPSALLNATTEYGILHHQVAQKPGPIAFQMIVVGFITIGINLWLISFEKMGYMGWFWSRFIGSVLSFLFFSYFLYYKLKLLPIFNFKWRLIKDKMKVAFPMIPHYYGSYLLTSSDRIVMDLYQVNIQKIGIYNLAGNFGNYFNAFADGTGMATGPVIYEYFRNLKRRHAFKLSRDLIFIWQAGMMLFSFLVCLWFKEIFSILINNPDLQDAYSLAIIMIMGFNYRPLYSGFAVKLFYYEKAGRIWLVSFGAGILNVVLNIIFIPIYGIEAAAITTFVAFLFLGLAGFFIKEYREMNDVNYFPFHWLIGIIIATVIVYFLKDIFWLYKIGISLFLLTVSLIWILKNKELIRSFDPKQSKQEEDKEKNQS
ncbi:MAG: lipopolysaccharide biosynthesis protein [Bacteroidota bacterium]